MPSSHQPSPTKIFLLICFFFCYHWGNSKDWRHVTDSLKQSLALTTNDTTKGRVYYELAMRYLFNHPDTCQLYGEEVLKLAEKRKNTWLEGVGHLIIGDACFSRSELLVALEHFLVSLNALETTKPMPKELPILYDQLMSLYVELSNYEAGEEYVEKSINAYKTLNASDELASTYNNAGDLYEKLAQYDKAKSYYSQAIQIALARKNQSLSLAIGYFNMASISRKQGNPKAAFEYIRLAMDISRKMNDVEGIIYNYIELGRLYLAQNEVDNALTYADSALTENNTYENLQLQKDIYFLKSAIFEKKNQTDSAFHYHKKGSSIKDSLLNEFSQKLVHSLTINPKITHLQQQSVLKEQALNRQIKQNELLLLIGAALAIALLGLFLFLRQKAKHNLLLQTQNQQIEEQKAALTTLNNNKDKLISIMSHDLRSPIQQIKSLLLLLNDNLISQKDFLVIMQRFHNQVDALAENLENILQWAHAQLRGKDTQKEVLRIDEAIQSVIKLYAHPIAEKEIQIETMVSPDFTLYMDKEHLKIALRNLLGNAIKFSYKGGKITFEATESGDVKILTLADEGMGMTEEQLQNLFHAQKSVSTLGTMKEIGTGIGLKLTKEFVEKSGGQLTVTSVVGKGSCFSIIVPAQTTTT